MAKQRLGEPRARNLLRSDRNSFCDTQYDGSNWNGEGKIADHPCYCLMFFNGIIDLMDIIAGSLIPAYFHFTGAVFCSSFALSRFSGFFAWCVWAGASLNCMVLALNRVIEMIPSAKALRFLFKGKLLYLWMVVITAYMVFSPFINRPHPFNTAVSAFISSPMITDDAVKEAAHYDTLLLPIHNITVVVVIFGLYSILCGYVIKMRRIAKLGTYKLQLQLFIQVLMICSTTTMTALLYSSMIFFTVSRSVAIAANVLWQLSHAPHSGFHAIVYLCLNRDISHELSKMFTRRRKISTLTVMNAAAARS
uniref:Serpentine Receptor, class T n=1 Tax=Haemonchus contortus TaxID=6289 RepID=A0A7I4YPF6_HAECO